MEEKPAELPVSPQETQIQPPSFMDKLKVHKLKILAGVLGILVFAGAVFGAYRLGQRSIYPESAEGPTPTPVVEATPTPDPTANWKTYTNTKYGYLIKYPEDGEVVSAKLSEVDMDQEELISPQLLIDNRTAALNVVIYENRQNLSLSEFAQTIFKEGVISQKSIVIGEISGYEMVVRGADTDNRYIFLGKDKLILEIFFPTADNPNDVKAKEHFDIFNLMLSTFRFISEEGTGEKVFCKEPRPEVCTMECIVNPPYICGSDGKSYCSECQACADPDIEWYVIQDELCKAE